MLKEVVPSTRRIDKGSSIHKWEKFGMVSYSTKLRAMLTLASSANLLATP